MKKADPDVIIPGDLVAIDVARSKVALNGFLSRGARPKRQLMIILHGMGGNFYRSRFKQRLLVDGRRHGFDVLSINTRGHEATVADERFSDCLADIDAALDFARRQGYRRVALFGHSTGCQKSVYYCSRRQPALVKAIVLAAPGDDYAIFRRDLGDRFTYWVRRARELVAAGQGETRLPAKYSGFSARRFLSVADPRQVEAGIFDYGGRLTHFGRVRCPMLAYFGDREEYACLPVEEMGAILRAKAKCENFHYETVAGGDHGFHGRERAASDLTYDWLKSVVGNAR